MQKYFLHNGTDQQGPFTIDELRSAGITSETMIWFEGLTEWKRAGSIDELKEVVKGVPPPFKIATPPPFEQKPIPSNKATVQSEPVLAEPIKKKKRSSFGALIFVLVVILIGAVVLMVSNNPNAIPGVKLEINTPKPVVITERADNLKSDLKLKTTVYTTIQNQGGAGNVLVSFHLFQDGKQFLRSTSIYLRPNQSTDLDATFDEVTRVGGNITYSVDAKIN